MEKINSTDTESWCGDGMAEIQTEKSLAETLDRPMHSDYSIQREKSGKQIDRICGKNSF